MAIKNGPNTGLLVFANPGEAFYDDFTKLQRWMDFFMNPNVTSHILAVPPGAPADGAAYIIPATGASGVWAGQGKKVARWTTDLLVPAWEFYTPKEGTALIYSLVDKRRYQFDGTLWTMFAQGGGSGGGGGGGSGDLLLAGSDIDTPLTVGTFKAFVVASRSGTIAGVKANLATPSSAGTVTVDVKKNGVSILSTPITIDATETTSLTAAVTAVISDDVVAADDVYSLDISGPGTGAKGLFLTLLFEEAPPLFVWNSQVADYTLTLADLDNGVAMDVASANTLTVPLNATVAFPVGATILIEQAGAGLTTLAAASGVTLQRRGTSSDMSGRYAVAALVKKATDTWLITGDMAP